MKRLVSSFEQVAKNIGAFADEVAKSPALQSRLGHVHVWYALRVEGGNWTFGPSKFVGYSNNTAREYLRTYKEQADGGETEQVLSTLSAPVDPASARGRELAAALETFLSQWGRRARRDHRIRVVAEQAEPAIIQRRTSDDALLARISSDPRICGGRPCIRGTRMRVVDIVEAIASGATAEELLRDFDYLSADDIAAALLYVARLADHRVVQTA
jgi:uncharacterized protein (DUF433 family)